MMITNPFCALDSVFRAAVSGLLPYGTQFAKTPSGCTWTNTIFKRRQALEPTLSM
jgi:hypothetical protein